MSADAILFDLDDTLVVEQASAQWAFLATCRRAHDRLGTDPAALTRSVRVRARELWRASETIAYCRTVGISSWEGLWARFLGADPNLAKLRAWAPSYRREAWARALADHGVRDGDLAAELAETFPSERRGLHVVYGDVRPALDELAGEFRLALVTNGAPDLQRLKLEAAGLEPYFQTVVVSGEVGVGKPDPRVFALALARLGVVAARTVTVGDSLQRDVAGAQRAGIRGIWLNRTGARRDRQTVPDAEISSLAELRALLE